jgi:glutathione reductase (NADPH)
VIRGCVPKKIMVYASLYGKHRLLAGDYGWPVGEGAFDWGKMKAARDELVHRLERIYEANLAREGVTLLRGRGVVTSPTSVEVDGVAYGCQRLLLAMGGAPVYPEGEGLREALVSDDLFELEACPRSALLVGGGYIAVEFAGILQGLGCEVSLVARGGLLRGFDEDLSASLVDALRLQGVKVYLGADIQALTHEDHYHLHVVQDGVYKRLEADAAVLYAIGRRPRTQGVGLESIGVALGAKGEVLVDEEHQTNVPGVFALGDLIDRANLTPVAIKAGRAFADTYYGGKPTRMDYRDIPTAIFSQPPIGTVGLTEAEALAAHGADGVKIYRVNFVPMAYTPSPSERKQRTFLKLIVHKESDRVLGVHMLGDDAPEIMQGFAVALKAGATKADFDNTVAIHPTQAEELVLMR